MKKTTDWMVFGNFGYLLVPTSDREQGLERSFDGVMISYIIDDEDNF